MKQLLIKSTLLLCFLIAWSPCVRADKTYRLEKVSSVEAGSLYVFEQDGHVMNNAIINSNALQTTTSYKTTGLSETETYVWVLETATDGYYMKNVSRNSKEYLNNTSSTTLAFGSQSTIWTFTFETEVALIKSSNGDRFLGYASAPAYAYRAFSTTSTDPDYFSICPHDITVYKLVEETAIPSSAISLTKAM